MAVARYCRKPFYLISSSRSSAKPSTSLLPAFSKSNETLKIDRLDLMQRKVEILDSVKLQVLSQSCHTHRPPPWQSFTQSLPLSSTRALSPSVAFVLPAAASLARFNVFGKENARVRSCVWVRDGCQGNFRIPSFPSPSSQEAHITPDLTPLLLISASLPLLFFWCKSYSYSRPSPLSSSDLSSSSITFSSLPSPRYSRPRESGLLLFKGNSTPVHCDEPSPTSSPSPGGGDPVVVRAVGGTAILPPGGLLVSGEGGLTSSSSTPSSSPMSKLPSSLSISSATETIAPSSGGANGVRVKESSGPLNWKKLRGRRHYAERAASFYDDDNDENDNEDTASSSQASITISGRTKASSSCYTECNEFSGLQIYSGTSNIELAREICAHLGVSLGRAYVGKYADGELAIQIMDETRGRDVFIVQSSPAAGGDIHGNLMELFLMITSLRRSSAKRITAVLPYLSYGRQTQQYDMDHSIQPIAAADLSVLLRTCGVDRILFVDLHDQGMEGFFSAGDFPPLPVTNIQPQSLAVHYFKKNVELQNPVVVSTESTGAERAKAFSIRMEAAGIETGLATTVSNRAKREAREWRPIVLTPRDPSGPATSTVKTTSSDTSASAGSVGGDGSKIEGDGQAGAWNLVGDVRGCDCIIVDDIIDSGVRVSNTAKCLKNAGARRIFVYATHGLFSKGAIERLNKSPIFEVIVTNTINIPSHVFCEKLRVLSVGKLLAETIRRIHCEQSVSSLYKDEEYDNSVQTESRHR